MTCRDGPEEDRPFSSHLPRSFERRVVIVAPGGTRPFHEAEWTDALIIVDGGEIELEGLSGRRYIFGQGDLLWLVGLPLRALHNKGSEPAVLVTVARRRGRR